MGWTLEGEGTETTEDEAVEIWRGVAAGRWVFVTQFDSDGRRYLVAQRVEHASTREPLTRRQREVLECAARGWSNKTISFHLGLTASTVSGHFAEAARRLGVNCRVRAVQAFRCAGLEAFPAEEGVGHA